MKAILRQQNSITRRGAASVEFAVVFPILFTVLVGSIEFARARQVMNAAAFSAYQGCRQAIVPGGSATLATSGAQQVLSATSISCSTITVTPTTITDSVPIVSVSVSVPLNSVGWITPIFTSGITITRTCTLTRQQTN